jgi:exodeoxyribonuclease-1
MYRQTADRSDKKKKRVFYDTETTGANPRFDQVLQMAAILTDEDFNEIEEIDVRSRLATHIIPSAGALRVTHVDPYEIARAPYAPYDFAHMLHETYKRWGADGPVSFEGFNTLNFDEEIMRQMFWENLHDPYYTTSKGNTRNDYLYFLRALHARNPNAIEFPDNPKTGKKSFKLEIVAPANGFEDHNAHDALGDVRATIFIARLIKEVDPALFDHMELMGNANKVKDFVESQETFRMLGGQMINPGILDVCLIATDATNPKSKVAWNLAVDPVPFLDLEPQEILDAMRKTGTPFRTLKCNKMPGVFPRGWEFLHRVETEDYSPPSDIDIDLRSDLIKNHDQFRRNVAEAMRLKIEGYADNETLEEKIYAGFPGWGDKDLMTAFQHEGDWARRLEIVRKFEKPELRQLGLRTIYVNAPHVMPMHQRTAFEAHIAKNRHGIATDMPWNTVGSMMKELLEMLDEDQDDPELLNIFNWAIETYPQAADYIPIHEGLVAAQGEEAEVAEENASNQEAASNDTSAGSQIAGQNKQTCKKAGVGDIILHDATPNTAITGKETWSPSKGSSGHAATAAHFLDGLD